MIRFFILALLVLFSGCNFLEAAYGSQLLPVLEDQFGCLNADWAAKQEKALHVDVQSFGGREVCRPEADYKKLMTSMLIINMGQFGQKPSQPNIFNRDTVPLDYGKFVTENTYSIQRGQDIPYATAYNDMGNVTVQDAWNKLAILGRVGTLIHEARHTKGYYHIRCNHGPYGETNVAGCDSTLEYGGSHAVEMEYYARVLDQGLNFHPLYRTMSRLMLLARAPLFFNKSPIQFRPTMVLSLKDATVIVRADGTTVRRQPILRSQNAEMRLKAVTHGTVMADFKNHQFAAVDIRGDGGVTPYTQEDYSYFKFFRDIRFADRRWLDAEEADLGKTWAFLAIDLEGHVLRYKYDEGDFSRTKNAFEKVSAKFYSLSNQEPGVRFLRSDADGNSGVFLLTKSGKLMKYDGSRWSPAKAFDFPVKTAWSMAGKAAAVGEDGTLYDFKSGQWVARSQFGKVEDLVMVNDYNFQQFIGTQRRR